MSDKSFYFVAILAAVLIFYIGAIIGYHNFKECRRFGHSIVYCVAK